MTDEKLKKGNDLQNEIRECKYSIESLKKAIKRTELETGCLSPEKFRIKIDGNECFVNAERVISFLNDELKSEEVNIRSLLKKYEQL